MIARWRLHEGSKRALKMIKHWCYGSDNTKVEDFEVGRFRNARCQCDKWCCSHKRKYQGKTIQELRYE